MDTRVGFVVLAVRERADIFHGIDFALGVRQVLLPPDFFGGRDVF